MLFHPRLEQGEETDHFVVEEQEKKRAGEEVGGGRGRGAGRPGPWSM